MSNKPPEILEFYWAFANVDASFWQSSAPATLFRSLHVRVSDPDGLSDIASVVFVDADGRQWVFDEPAAGGEDLYGGYYCYSSARPHSVPLGMYTVRVTDSHGEVAQSEVLCRGPDAASGYSFAFSPEDYAGPYDGGIPALARAQSITASLVDPDTINIEFTCNDPRFWNGYIWLYDAGGTYLGGTDFFAETINGGNGVYNNDLVNTLTITDTDIWFETGVFSDIAELHIVLTDGDQYSPAMTYYDYRSVSARVTL